MTTKKQLQVKPQQRKTLHRSQDRRGQTNLFPERAQARTPHPKRPGHPRRGEWPWSSTNTNFLINSVSSDITSLHDTQARSTTLVEQIAEAPPGVSSASHASRRADRATTVSNSFAFRKNQQPPQGRPTDRRRRLHRLRLARLPGGYKLSRYELHPRPKAQPALRPFALQHPGRA